MLGRTRPHLIKLLEQHYKIKSDWSGQCYIGVTLDWDYQQQQVHLTMSGYIKKHIAQTKKNAPYLTAMIKYGAKKQYSQQESTAPPLNKTGKKFIQQVCGKFLFLGRGQSKAHYSAQLVF